MKKIYIFFSMMITMHAISQINSPNGNNIFYYNGGADVTFKYPPRGSGGRAFVHADNNILALNFQGDFTGGTSIGNDVYFKDGGNSYILSGNFGIGTATPSYKLDIMGSFGIGNASVNANTTKLFLRNPAGKTWAISSGANMVTESSFSIYNWTDNQTSPFFHISTNGNVGIGTVSPAVKLDIFSTDVAAFFRSSSNPVPASIINTGNPISTLGFKGSTSATEYNVRVGADGNDFISYTSNIERMRINSNGNVGIGTPNPLNKLDVKGIIHSQEVKVDMLGWSDFVFKKEYTLPTLEEVEKHIKEKGYLENIPSEEEVLKNGISLGEMNVKLLQKIEELTLYMIQQNNKLKSQENEILELKKDNSELTEIKQRLARLESR